jgi:hypothetical protein
LDFRLINVLDKNFLRPLNYLRRGTCGGLWKSVFFWKTLNHYL